MINELLEIVLEALALVLAGFLVPYLKGKIGEAKYYRMLELIDIAVEASEQIYKTSPKGEPKNNNRYQYVYDLLELKGIKIKDEEIEALIESAVLRLNKALR